MGVYLQVGVVSYLVSIGLAAYLAVKCFRECSAAFTTYTAYFAGQGIVLFTLLSQGNGGIYVTAYWTSEYIQDALIAWIVIDIAFRCNKMTKMDKHILAGLGVNLLIPFPAQYALSTPQWTMYVPVYCQLVASGIWWKGLREQ